MLNPFDARIRKRKSDDARAEQKRLDGIRQNKNLDTKEPEEDDKTIDYVKGLNTAIKAHNRHSGGRGSKNSYDNPTLDHEGNPIEP